MFHLPMTLHARHGRVRAVEGELVALVRRNLHGGRPERAQAVAVGAPREAPVVGIHVAGRALDLLQLERHAGLADRLDAWQRRQALAVRTVTRAALDLGVPLLEAEP